MGKRGATRVTAQDIAAAGSLPKLIKQLVKRMIDGEMATREQAAVQLCSLAVQGHGEHCVALHNGGAVRPLVRLLIEGTAKSQSSACGALGAIASVKDEHQKTLVEAGGVAPLVRLLKTGSPKVQEQVKAQPSLSNRLSVLPAFQHIVHSSWLRYPHLGCVTLIV